jgi:hypothetical protein
MTKAWLAIVALMGLGTSFSANAIHYVYTGNILTGAQFDTYVIPVQAGDFINATLVCDEVAPGDRPLDPVLSLFLPGVPATDVQNSAAYSDDQGNQACNAFRSSLILFRAQIAGQYTFRADGFGSAIGPYTLTIDTTPGSAAIPALSDYALIVLGALVAAFAMRRLRGTA